MCWNAPVSFLTFLSSIIMCLYLWHRNNSNNNDRALSIFICWFALMQLFEFFMWKNMQDHSLASKLSFLSLQLQPFILVASLYYFSLKAKTGALKYSKFEKGILLSVALLSFIKTLSSTYYAFITNTKTKWLSVKGPNCHLMWWFVENKDLIPRIAQVDHLYFILLFIACAMVRPFMQGVLYALSAFISCAYTFIYYPREIGSIWCWIANLMGIFAIGMPYAMSSLMSYLRK